MTIRDYQTGDADAIQQLLETSAFDPEGPLAVDCGSDSAIRESYLAGDGVFLVAVDDDGANQVVVGTAGLVIGTAVAYQSSGSSMSTPTITGAVRRVSGSTLDVCEELLVELERRAEGVVQEFIALAYPAVRDQQERPTAEILRRLGYERSNTQLPGTNVVQFGKRIIKAPSTELGTAQAKEMQEKSSTTELVNGLEEALLAGVLVLFFALATATAQFMGLDVFSDSNSGLGSPLSSEELNRLRQDERLQRTTLDEADERQWQDLSPEEQREEVALMKIIQGQDIRAK